MNKYLRTKPVNCALNGNGKLKSCLTAFDLVFMGIGAIIGAGIFVLTGIAAATKAGPAVVLSFVVSGMACAFTAMSYAELASSVGGCGSAYGYAYAGMGELAAWIIGWDLLLEYAVSVSTVAVGWSGYVDNALTACGISLPTALLTSPFQGGIINLPAVVIVMLTATLLIIGVKVSAHFNMVIVSIKLTVIAIFIGIATANINPANWHPFMPFHWQGVMSGAALVFFAYIGFDALSTAAEEVINPQRDLPIGILVSLVVCTTLYIVVSGLLTGIIPYQLLNVSSPLSAALLHIGYRFGAALIAVGAIAGLTTVTLIMYYGFTRIMLAMSRDRLLPGYMSYINPKTQTPIRIIILGGSVIALFAGIIPLTDLAELVNIGTLAAFVIVCSGVMLLRRQQPNLVRPFKTPFGSLFPILGILFCLYLMFSLPWITWLRFVSWMLVGIIIYFTYSQKRSLLNLNHHP